MEKDPSLNGSSEKRLLLAPVLSGQHFQEVNGQPIPVTFHALSEAQRLSQAGRVVIVEEEKEYTLAFSEGYTLPTNFQLGEHTIRLISDQKPV